MPWVFTLPLQLITPPDLKAAPIRYITVVAGAATGCSSEWLPAVMTLLSTAHAILVFAARHQIQNRGALISRSRKTVFTESHVGLG